MVDYSARYSELPISALPPFHGCNFLYMTLMIGSQSCPWPFLEQNHVILFFNKHHNTCDLSKEKKKKTLQGSAASQNGCLCKTNSWRNVLTRLWQEVVAVFHTISSVMWGFHKFNGDCSQQVTFNQLPLLELFHSLIYLFILTIGFLSFSPHQFLLQGGWGDRKWWILSRGLVRCCENPLGPSNSSVSTFYAHTSLHLSLRYHKNQLIRPAKH